MLLTLFSAVYRYHIIWLFAALRGSSKTVSSLPSSTSPSPPTGEYDAFVAQLFQTHYASLCRAVYPLVRDRAVAEDMVQDVFLKVWRDQRVLDTLPTAKAYLFRAAINTALNFLEKNKRQAPWDDTLADQVGENSTEDTLAYQETEQKIAWALEQLPPRCKVVFSLSRFEEMSYAEIAQHLSISVKAVEKHMGKALKIMRLHVFG